MIRVTIWNNARIRIKIRTILAPANIRDKRGSLTENLTAKKKLKVKRKKETSGKREIPCLGANCSSPQGRLSKIGTCGGILAQEKNKKITPKIRKIKERVKLKRQKES